MNAAHHLERSQLYLGFVTRDVLGGEYHRAARAVHRAATHAATAAAIHWHHRHYSLRRLNTALSGLVRDGLMGYRHLRTFREVHRLTDLLAEAGDDMAAVRALLRRARRRVERLRQAVVLAMARDPNPLSIADYLARKESGDPAFQPEPSPPPITTMGEYRRALGLYVSQGTENHPLDCNCCRIR